MEDLAVRETPYRIADKRHEAIYYLSFLVWPFGVMLTSLRHWERPWAKNVFWIFCIFFGFTFIFGQATEDSADSSRLAQKLVEYAHSDMSLAQLWKTFYSEGSDSLDFVQPVLTYLISRVTANGSVLFAVFGLIFGYFYSRNIWYILEKINGKITPDILLFIVTFAILVPVWYINGFRYWTAAHIFLYGTLPYLYEGNTKKLFWAGISVFFHFSFMFAVIILFLFIFIRNRINIYMILFLITAFIKEIDLQYVQSVLSFLPEIFQPRVRSYASTDYAETIHEASRSLNWYIPLAYKGLKWGTYIMTVSVYYFGRKVLKERKDLMTLFCFILLIHSIANIFSLVPSGGRFITVSHLFLYVFFTIFISTYSNVRGVSFIKKISFPLLIPFCFVAMRAGMDYYGLMTIFGNPLFAAFTRETAPLIIAIKQIIFG